MNSGLRRFLLALGWIEVASACALFLWYSYFVYWAFFGVHPFPFTFGSADLFQGWLVVTITATALIVAGFGLLKNWSHLLILQGVAGASALATFLVSF